MPRHYPKFPGHGKPGRNRLSNERPKTMPSHTECNTNNYDCFKSLMGESSSNIEDAGLGRLIAVSHYNGGFGELSVEIEQCPFSNHEEVDAMFKSCINQDMCSDSKPGQKITSVENSTEASAATATPFVSVLYEEDAAGNFSWAFRSLLQDHDPILFEVHAAKNLSWAFKSSPQVHGQAIRVNNASRGDPGPSIISSGGAGLTKVTITGLASSAQSELSEGSETRPRNTSLAPDFGYVPATMTSPAQYDAAPTLDIRHRRSNTEDSIAKRAKSFRDTKNKDYTISPAEIHITSFPATSAKFLCSVCRKKFRDNNNLREHEKTHTKENPTYCDVDGCEQTTQRPRDMIRHKREKHNGISPLKCPHCPNTYKRPESLKSHVKKEHPGN
ncbi:hypothetical protein BGZ68_002298 [Mortierella alpina]|nr:hypothetical protein BGZ68_002298 [Mortierella alpina]